jgi:hypothetical protein
MRSNAAASDGIRRRRELLAGFNPKRGKEARANPQIFGQRFPAKPCARTDRAGGRSIVCSASRAATDVHHAIMT